MIDFYRRGTMKFRCFIAALASAVLIILVLAIVAHCFNPNTSDSIGDNFSGMIGSTLALIGMSVAGSVFLIEFLESNAEKDSRYDTVSDDFRQDMESCIKQPLISQSPVLTGSTVDDDLMGVVRGCNMLHEYLLIIDDGVLLKSLTPGSKIDPLIGEKHLSTCCDTADPYIEIKLLLEPL